MVEGKEAVAEGGNTLVVLPGFNEPRSAGTLEGRVLAPVSVAGPLFNPVAPVDGTRFG